MFAFVGYHGEHSGGGEAVDGARALVVAAAPLRVVHDALALDGVEGYRLRIQAVGGRDERAAVCEVWEGYRGFERYHAAERAADYGAQPFYAERFERGFLREGSVARR